MINILKTEAKVLVRMVIDGSIDWSYSRTIPLYKWRLTGKTESEEVKRGCGQQRASHSTSYNISHTVQVQWFWI